MTVKSPMTLGKQATIFAAIFIVSMGLCGATAFLTRHQEYGGSLGLPLGLIELLGMIIGAGGLVIIGLIALVKLIVSGFSKDDNDNGEQ